MKHLTEDQIREVAEELQGCQEQVVHMAVKVLSNQSWKT